MRDIAVRKRERDVDVDDDTILDEASSIGEVAAVVCYYGNSGRAWLEPSTAIKG